MEKYRVTTHRGFITIKGGSAERLTVEVWLEPDDGLGWIVDPLWTIESTRV